MKLTHSYKQSPVTEPYDVIMIGSGIGGLTAAALLTKAGKRVLVLERHYTAGGFTHMFKRKDYEWDVGIHYLGEVHHPSSVLAQVFDYLSDGQLQWADMGAVYDKIIFGDEVYDFRTGIEEFKGQLKEYFPDRADQEAIDAYVQLVFDVAKASGSYFAARAIPKVGRFLFGALMRRGLNKIASQTTRQVLEGITKNEKLIGVLTGQYGDYGLPPAQSSFAMHAMVAKHYFRGGSYPVGGSTRIFDTIAPLIINGGGAIYTNADVKEIIVEGNKATGVRLADGVTIKAPMVISSAGIMNTYNHLIPQAVSEKAGFPQQMRELTPSSGHLSLYIGLKHTAEELGIDKPNLWIYPANYNHDENLARFMADENEPLPVVYISFPGAKDPEFTTRFPGRTTIEIITIAPYERFAEWDGSRWKHRGEEYDAYKEKLSQRLLEYLYKYVPQTKGKVDYYELSTPLTTKHFINYQHGEIYGIDHTPDRFAKKFLLPETPIKGLYLTGQDIVTAGVGGALFGGVITASAILQKNLIKGILEDRAKVAKG
ncbi:NAD(P)/FAD-dependent oxidoreductase [soil metagenome]